MSQPPDDGMGLENVRRRLHLAYGDAAGVELRDAAEGAIAEITIPMGAAK
jgi:LytS/YehU family sensor histidine kinase